MDTITLHYSDTEEIFGTVTQAKEDISEENSDKLLEEVYQSWVKFNEPINWDDYTHIELFVEFHNDRVDNKDCTIKIDYVYNQFIQL